MVEYQMSIPFAVKHKKAGYLIVVLVPLGWLFIIGQLERIREKGYGKHLGSRTS